MMTKEESESDKCSVVLSAVLHKNLLTWLVVEDKEKSVIPQMGKILVRQKNLATDNSAIT